MIIGLTGQTGAGKSTVCEFFSKKGFAVIDCDKVAREVTQKGNPVLLKLAECFGDDILSDDGNLNRRLLANRAFASEEKTKLLNSITHPEIYKAIQNKIKNTTNDIIVLDAPTLFESGANKLCDKVVAVIAPSEIRKERIMKRDLISEEQAKLRMSAQKNDEFYIEKSDAVVENNCSHRELTVQIEQALNSIGVK